MEQHSTSRTRRQPGRRQTGAIYVGARVVGHVTGDTFHKTIMGSKHMLRQPKAIAFDASTLADAEAAGAAYCEVHDGESGHNYRTTIAHIRAKGFSLSRGFGVQIALVLAQWTVDGRPPAAPPPPAERPQQLALFGGGA
jgi:hypothetical protein